MSFYMNFVAGGTQQASSSKALVVEHPRQNLRKDTPEEVELRDAKNRRIISKEILMCEQFECPPRPKKQRKKMKNGKQIGQMMQANQPKNKLNFIEPLNLDKAARQSKNMHCGKQFGQRMQMQSNQPRVKSDAIVQPINLDKAARIMAKMGWRGGALGKTGVGIVEPILPNTVYARSTVGLGVAEFRPDPPQPTIPRPTVGKVARRHKKHNFKMSVLKIILDFVRNDYEVEIMFDSKLTNGERKNIHDVVADLAEYESPDPEDASVTAKGYVGDMFYEIRKYDSYVLVTQSEGQGKNRALCLYKDAPEHMYLVTHLDLRDEPEEKTEDSDSINTDDDFADIIVPSATHHDLRDEPEEKTEDSDSINTDDDFADIIFPSDKTQEDETVKSENVTIEIQDEKNKEKIKENDFKSNGETIQHTETVFVVTETTIEVKDEKNKEDIKGNDFELNGETIKHPETVSSVTETGIDLKSSVIKGNDLVKPENVQIDVEDINANEFVNLTVSIKPIEDKMQLTETKCSNSGTKMGPLVAEVKESMKSENVTMVLEDRIKEDDINESCDDQMLQDVIDCDATPRIIKKTRKCRENIPPKRNGWKKKGIPIKVRTTNVKRTLLLNKEKKKIGGNGETVEKETEIKNLVLEYFSEFCNSKKYTDFKFLGDFQDVEVQVIDEFINNVWCCTSNSHVDDGILNIIKNAGCTVSVRTDYNGSAV